MQRIDGQHIANQLSFTFEVLWEKWSQWSVNQSRGQYFLFGWTLKQNSVIHVPSSQCATSFTQFSSKEIGWYSSSSGWLLSRNENFCKISLHKCSSQSPAFTCVTLYLKSTVNGINEEFDFCFDTAVTRTVVSPIVTVAVPSANRANSPAAIVKDGLRIRDDAIVNIQKTVNITFNNVPFG